MRYCDFKFQHSSGFYLKCLKLLKLRGIRQKKLSYTFAFIYCFIAFTSQNNASTLSSFLVKSGNNLHRYFYSKSNKFLMPTYVNNTAVYIPVNGIMYPCNYSLTYFLNKSISCFLFDLPIIYYCSFTILFYIVNMFSGIFYMLFFINCSQRLQYV